MNIALCPHFNPSGLANSEQMNVYASYGVDCIEEHEDFVVIQYSNGGNFLLFRNGVCMGSCWNPTKLHGSNLKWYNKMYKHYKKQYPSVLSNLEGVKRSVQDHLMVLGTDTGV